MKDKTGLIMVTNYYFPTVGGISTYVESLVEGLSSKAYGTEILCYPLVFRKWESKAAGKSAKRLIHSIFTLFFIAISELRILRKRFSNKRLIVHSHSANFCLFIGVVSKAFGCKSIHTYHSPIEKSYKNLEKLSPEADAIVFVSNEAKKLYQKLCRIENKMIEIIPGVIDQNKFKPRNKKEVAEFKIDLEDLISKKHLADRLILFVGRVIDEKGVMPLVKSVKIVKKTVPGIYLIITGPHGQNTEEKKFYRDLQAYIAQNKLGDNITFTGPLSAEHTVKLYSISELVVCPSKWETSGIVPIEAMASGKPVIATRVGGLQRRIIDGRTGFLVEKNDHRALADKITVLLKNKRLLNEMGLNARLHVEKNYSRESMVAKYNELYDTL